MADDLYTNIAEAIIFASDKPVSNRVISSKLPDDCNVQEILESLKIKYENRGINLSKVGDSWAFRTSPKVADYLVVEKTVQKKLSKAALEILSIIAYYHLLLLIIFYYHRLLLSILYYCLLSLGG